MTSDSNNEIEPFWKSVIKYILFMLAAISVFVIMITTASCSSVKKVEKKTDESVTECHDSTVNSISFNKQWFEKMIESNVFVNDYLKITVYDTSLPIDSATNKRPVAAEIERTTNTHSNTVEKNTSENVSCDTVSVIEHDVVEIKKHEEVVEKTNKKAFDSFRFYLFVGVVVLCLVAALWGKNLIQEGVSYLLNKIFR